NLVSMKQTEQLKILRPHEEHHQKVSCVRLDCGFSISVCPRLHRAPPRLSLNYGAAWFRFWLRAVRPLGSRIQIYLRIPITRRACRSRAGRGTALLAWERASCRERAQQIQGQSGGRASIRSPVLHHHEPEQNQENPTRAVLQRGAGTDPGLNCGVGADGYALNQQDEAAPRPCQWVPLRTHTDKTNPSYLCHHKTDRDQNLRLTQHLSRSGKPVRTGSEPNQSVTRLIQTGGIPTRRWINRRARTRSCSGTRTCS
ncbi:hypothetical protein GOODEAATRI_031116, partial [Goodea atripinnis]